MGDERTITVPVLAGGPVPAASCVEAALRTSRGPASLYMHIPFCFHKCHYCDFYSIVDEHDRQDAFTQRLDEELRALGAAASAARSGRARAPLRTIFVGGGTPSLLRADLWRRLLRTLAEAFDLSTIRAGAGDAEFTVECNPETVTDDLAGVLREGGVDRISMGAQSFDPAHLRTLERWHDPASVERAVETFRRVGGGAWPRLSVDLIFAIPGQTIDQWRRDLDRALALRTDHLSCYNLTYEPNTAMTARLRRGEFEPAPEETEAEMYAATVEMAARAGLARYEVSNYARPGHESRHNLVYWRSGEWLAAGPGASGHVGGWRWTNAPNLRAYLERTGPFAPATTIEPPDPARALRERIMMGLRIAEGLPAAEVMSAGEALAAGTGDRLGAAVERLERNGLMRRGRDDTGTGRWVLSDAGFLCADHVAAELMRVAPRSQNGE